MALAIAFRRAKLCERLSSRQRFRRHRAHEAFAAQALAVLPSLGARRRRGARQSNGGAIALGHPLGAPARRLAGTAAIELKLDGKKRALATMCIGVGQGIRSRSSGVRAPGAAS